MNTYSWSEAVLRALREMNKEFPEFADIFIAIMLRANELEGTPVVAIEEEEKAS